MRNWSIKNIEDRKYDFVPFTPRFADLFGKTEATGNWIVYGKSGQGKSSFCLQLAKEFDEIGKKVLFVSLEMGDSYDFQQALANAGIRSGCSRISFTDSCNPEELKEELSKQRSADVIIIDSLQYFIDLYRVRAADFIELRSKFKKKVFVYISHMKGNDVDGDTAYDLKKDAFKRIHIEHFKASYVGRGNGGPKGFFVIWDKGYRQFWLENGTKKETNGNDKENMIPKWMIKKLHVLYARYGLSEEQYRALILELTDGRTDTTKGLTYAESQYLAGYITGANTTIKPVAERLIEKSLKWQRSAVLKRLQQIGVDTSSWDAVNAYLRSPRIAGKPLYELDSEELAALIPKLESIKRKQNG